MKRKFVMKNIIFMSIKIIQFYKYLMKNLDYFALI